MKWIRNSYPENSQFQSEMLSIIEDTTQPDPSSAIIKLLISRWQLEHLPKENSELDKMGSNLSAPQTPLLIWDKSMLMEELG